MVASLAGFLLCGQAIAAQIQNIKVFPVTSEHVLVMIQADQPFRWQILRVDDLPSIQVEADSIHPNLLTRENLLVPSAFIRRDGFAVSVKSLGQPVLLQFQSRRPLSLSVSGSDAEMLAQAARLLPVYRTFAAQHRQPASQPMVLVQNAQQAFVANNPAQAVGFLEGLYEGMSKPPQALYQLLGLLYLREQNWLKALTLYSEGAKAFPQGVGLRYSALLYQLGQPEKAAIVLRDMLQSRQLSTMDAAQANYMLGTIYTEQQRYDLALPYLQSASGVFRQSPQVLYNLAIAYEGVKQTNQAIETYHEARQYAANNLNQEIGQQLLRLQHQLQP